MMLKDPFVTDNLVSHQDTPWANIDQMIKTPAGNESRISQPSFSPQSCSCSDTTGPCPGHLEKMRTQVSAETTSPLSLHQQYQSHYIPVSDLSTSPQPHQTSLSQSNFSKSGYVLFVSINWLCCGTWVKYSESPIVERTKASLLQIPMTWLLSKSW